jgi:23S rRNA (pseudouridine1915-N3)-methyltransferase
LGGCAAQSGGRKALKLKLMAIGKMKRGPLGEVAEDYIRRIQKLHPFEVQEIPEKSYRAAKDIGGYVKQESELIRRRCKPGACLIVLEEKGKQFTSVGLAAELEKLLASSAPEVIFVVGGAYGLSESIKQEAKLSWSLSKLTLPHQLARVLTLEQIYRALTILKNIPYHHE